jgi:hypothetical protein
VVKDPSGALVAGARVEVSGGTLNEPLALTTNGEGKFSAPNLVPGRYSVRASKEGFENSVTSVDLNGTSDLLVSLTITSQQTSISVTGKAAAFANSDPAYRQLREIGLGKTYHCENFTLPMDVGTFDLKSGTITLLGMVNRNETGAIFIGQGHFTLKPLTHIDKDDLKRRYSDGSTRILPGSSRK